MASLNKVFLIGNLTRDPELRYTPTGTPICEFGMAVNRTYRTKDGEQRDDTCFVNVAMWGRRGEVISEYFSKGSPILIEGRLKFDTWESAEGRRSKLSVVAENFEFMGRAAPGEVPAEAESDRPRRPQRQQRTPPPAEEKKEDVQEGFDVSDDEIPF